MIVEIKGDVRGVLKAGGNVARGNISGFIDAGGSVIRR